ncbi:MAG: Mut7-C RNAse domain-containing protein [Chloroflexota bacterium]
MSDFKFIVDKNVGKLAKWLRAMGYDTLFFADGDDSAMVRTALTEGRVILTRDTQIMRRRVVASGRLKALLIASDEPGVQMRQVIDEMELDCQFRPLAICLECNQPLVARSRPEVEGLVPPYVFETQSQYRECPLCHRIYWRGTHWQAMTRQLERFRRG